MPNKQHQQRFKIKIGDLLKNPGSTDDIHINTDASALSDLPNLVNITQPFVAEMHLNSISNTDIFVKLSNIILYENVDCDICAESFDNKIEMDSYECIYTTDEAKLEYETDEYRLIDSDMNIDLSDIIHDIIYISQPVVYKCPDCTIRNPYTDDEDNEDEY